MKKRLVVLVVTGMICLVASQTMAQEPLPPEQEEFTMVPGPRCDIRCRDDFFSGDWGSLSIHCGPGLATGRIMVFLEGDMCECVPIQEYKRDKNYVYFREVGGTTEWAIDRYPAVDRRHWIWVKAQTSPIDGGSFRKFELARRHRAR